MRISSIARLTTAVLLLSAMQASADTPAPPQYRLVATVALGSPERWDFVTFDPSSNRAYVSHRTQVDVVDLAAGKVVGEIAGLGASHGIAIAPTLHRGFADDGAAKTVTIFDTDTLAKIAIAPADTDADAVVYDSASGRVFVMNADGQSITAIDAAKGETIKTMPLGGAPEFAASNGAGTLFVAIASTNEIVEFDTHALAITARWPVPACERPHGVAMDTASNRLFVSCVNAKMIVVDATKGTIVAALPIGKGTDSAAFDPVHKLAYSSNADGTLSVIAEHGADDFVALGDVKTYPGARTMAIDPQTGRVFLVTADVAGTEPDTGRGPHLKFTPGSLKLYVLQLQP